MKNIQTYVILALLILLIFAGLHIYNKTGKLETSNIKERIDSAIIQHQRVIAKIQRQKKIITLKLRIDSVKHLKEIQVYRKQITYFQKQLKEAKYTGNPSTVPDDSVKIAMQALKEAPIKDTIISRQDKEIVTQNASIEGLQSDYTSLLDGYQKELNNVNDIADLRKKQVDELTEQNKKQRRKGVWQSVKVGVVALGVGYVIGLSR